MINKRIKKYFIVLLLISIEIFLSYYIANYTFRIKKQDWTFLNDDEITCMSITATGALFGIGDKNGSIMLISKGMSIPRWRYFGKFEVLSIKLSTGGDYIVATDSNDTISFFSQNPYLRDGKISPLWRRSLPACKIKDIYSSQGSPPLVFVLSSSGGNAYIYTKNGEMIWEYQTEADEVDATFSRDGLWMVIGDSKGNIYLFKLGSKNPLWSFQTDSQILSVDISFNNNYIVAGGKTREGKGQIYLLSLKDGEVISQRQVDNPIRNVYISYDGKRIIADKEDGSVVVIYYNLDAIQEYNFRISNKIQSIMTSIFGSYIVASNPEGEVYLKYLNRPSPLWKFSVRDREPLLEITRNGEYIFVSDLYRIFLLSNTELSEMIPGSRIGWAVVFFLGVGIIIFLYITSHEFSLNHIEKNDFLSIIIGLILGVFIGLIITKNIHKAVFYCGGSSLITSLLCWRNKSILFFLFGSCIGILVSGASGFLLGLFIWFSGDERNIFELILQNIFNGFKIGMLFAPLGAIIGTFVVGFIVRKFTHMEY